MSANVEEAPLSAALASCGHCGLPARAGDRFCCYGCELASEIAGEAAQDHTRTRSTMTFALIFSMVVMMFSLFLYAEDIYGAGEEAGLMWLRTFYRVASVVLAAPVLALCGVPLARHALRRLREGHLSMSALIALGAFSAFGLSVYAVLTGGTDVYLDSAATSVVLATLGRYLEATARSKASGVIGPAVDSGMRAVRIGGALVAPQALLPGDRVEIDPEQVVPADLRLLSEAAELDLGVLSGESAPVTLRAGDVVAAGAVPVSSAITGEVLRVARESTAARLADLARGLRERPSLLMRLADGFARALTPLVWILALGTLAYWTQAAGIERGVVNALAVVLVACPCSYAIATPLVHWLAMRHALQNGVLFRNAEVLEKLARVERVAFDKTGTLTGADLEVTAASFAAPEPEVRALVRVLEADSPHPVARALFRFAGEVTPAPISGRRFEAGRGVSARDSVGRSVALAASSSGGDVALTRDGAVLATFTLAERVRSEARAAVQSLAAMGVAAEMLTGDRHDKAERVAAELGIPHRAELQPASKVDALLGPERSRPTAVAMVGDGLNDAPALAGVTSFAMAGATGLSRGVAQVNLLRDDLALVPFSVDLARRSTRLIRRLLFASTAYNAVFLALAIGGALRPVWAGLSMLIASLLTLAMASSVSSWPEASR